MKQALRRGPYSALNIYFQTNLSSPPYTYTYNGGGVGGSTALLGYCTLPTSITYPVPGSDGAVKAVEYPMVDYATDGCNVLAGSMPRAPQGSRVSGYDLGKTAVHEVGHWFGLLHTFQVGRNSFFFFFFFFFFKNFKFILSLIPRRSVASVRFLTGKKGRKKINQSKDK